MGRASKVLLAMSGRPTYAEYERRRLGSPETRWAGIAYSFRRSFGASSFAAFWRYWNPLFSYYLYYRCYRPLSRFLPRFLAVILTFAVSGAIHDFFASLVTADFFVLFTPVFGIFGLLVVIEERIGWRFAGAPFWLRAALHSAVIGGAVTLGVVVRSLLQ